MIMTQLASMCCTHNGCSYHTARVADWAIGLTLLVLGILGILGVINLPSYLTFAFLGAGAIYTASMLVNACLEIRMRCCLFVI